MSLTESVRQWWQSKGKRVFPGINRLGRKITLDVKNKIDGLDRKANDVWAKNNGLRTDFRHAVGKGPDKPKILDPALMKEAAAKKIVEKARTPELRQRLTQTVNKHSRHSK